VLRRRGAFVEADEHYRAAIATLRKLLPAGIVEFEVFSVELGRINLLRRMGSFADASVEQRRVLDEATASLGTANHTVHKLESQFARALLEAGTSLEEAEQHARHALDGMLTELGTEDLNTILAADTLNAVICARGRPQEAEGLARELLRAADEQGVTEPIVLVALRHTLGQCLMEQGRLAEAQTQLLSAWSNAENDPTSNDPYDPRRLALIRDAVRLFEAQGDTERAAEFRARLTPPPARD
jgi:tetratricopeptide (TPR) repeat protein